MQDLKMTCQIIGLQNRPVERKAVVLFARSCLFSRYAVWSIVF